MFILIPFGRLFPPIKYKRITIMIMKIIYFPTLSVIAIYESKYSLPFRTNNQSSGATDHAELFGWIAGGGER